LSLASGDLSLAELAFDSERRRFTTPRNDVRLSRLLERGERDSSLLLRLDLGRSDSIPLDVEGLESVACAEFLLHDVGRRSQDGDNKSFDVGASVAMTSSDMGDG
jgi:hypothetical protein